MRHVVWARRSAECIATLWRNRFNTNGSSTMIIYATNILVSPLLLMVWFIELYLLLVAARLILGKLPGLGAARIATGLQPLTDVIPHAVDRWLAKQTDRAVPTWLPWGIAILGGLAIQHVLFWAAVSMC